MSRNRTATVSPIDIQRNLKGISYPAEKREIVDTARQNDADDRIMQILERLPDRTYDQVTDVSEAIANQS